MEFEAILPLSLIRLKKIEKEDKQQTLNEHKAGPMFL